MEVYYQPEILAGVLELSPEESKHCIKVLRHQSGEIINVADGRGTLFEARIIDPNPKKCTFKILRHKRKPDKKFTINITIAPTKSIDRLEWFVEKSVELGVDEIMFYFGRHSERKKLNMERIEKKAIAAMKQSEQFILPKMTLYQSFSTCLNAISKDHQLFIAHVDQNNPYHLLDLAEKQRKYTVFIGPEGDFSEEELIESFDKGFTKVSLGDNRLRTETAGIAACHILNLLNR
ncbi:MAG: 16S rRNA (uracil(1498)-N(3))-methyltransferase [Bacteroidota bacterium]